MSTGMIEVLELELRNIQDRLSHLEAATDPQPDAPVSDDEKPPQPGPPVDPEERNGKEPGLVKVSLDESVWSLAVVVGLEKSSFNGFFDCFVSGGLALMTIIAQSLFLGILLSQEQLMEARLWRNRMAHDAKFMDLSGHSWAWRVCENFEGFWGSKLREINDHLALRPNDLEMTSAFRPGSVMCILCIFLWSLMVMKEVRMYWLTCQGLYWAPRSEESTEGRTVSVSSCRVWSLIFVYFLRTAIASALLAGGVLWLAKTTSLLEMMFMTAAFPMILNIDKHVFAAIMPMEIKLGIQKFPPFQLTYSRVHSQMEAFLGAFLIATVLLVTYSQLIGPRESLFLQVKRELCAGHLDFVASYNPDTQLTYAMREMAEVPAVRAVEDYKFSSSSACSSGSCWKPLIFTEARRFWLDTSRTMQQEAQKAPCWELSSNESDATWALLRSSAARALLVAPGETEAPSCEEMADRCLEPSARLLRLACGVTCGCTELKSPWYRVEAQGCSSKCLAQSAPSLLNNPCDNVVSNQTWNDLWDEYVPVLSGFLKRNLSQDETSAASQLQQSVQGMKSEGCGYLLKEPFEWHTGAKWCEGHPDLFRPFADLCPESCGLCI
ncbi:unnamed protein product [Durusdinium trenchii]|uniref:Uncharacterized protein n=1 Tax=Durusdinium trenchii TaxID=1381693 RepID=A0ABP0P1R6_9DINO